MKNDSEKETKKKRGKSIGCGCLSIFVLSFILIGIFAEDPKPDNAEQKPSPAAEVKQEEVKTEAPKTAPATEKEESAKGNSEAEKLQDAIDGYYEQAKEMRTRAEAINTGKEKLSVEQKKALIATLNEKYFSDNKLNPQRTVELQSQYLKERRNALERCTDNLSDLTEKHKECLAKVLANKGGEHELKKVANKLKLTTDLFKQIQQDCVMQDALLKLKESAYDLLMAVGGEDYFEKLQEVQKEKEKSVAEILASAVVRIKLRVNSNNNYSGTPKFTFSITNNSKRHLSLIGGELILKTRDDEIIITEKDVIAFFAEKKDGAEVKAIAPDETRTFTVTEKDLSLTKDGWDRLLVVNNYVVQFNVKRVRLCDSPDSPSKEHDEYDIDE